MLTAEREFFDVKPAPYLVHHWPRLYSGMGWPANWGRSPHHRVKA